LVSGCFGVGDEIVKVTFAAAEGLQRARVQSWRPIAMNAAGAYGYELRSIGNRFWMVSMRQNSSVGSQSEAKLTSSID
jgi:hypothetical protein